MKTRHVPDDHPTVEKQVEEDRERMEEELVEEGDDQPERLAPVQLEVQRQYREYGKDVGPPEYDNEVVVVEGFHVEPAEVALEKSMTLNLGNYESARMSVSIRVPCYREEAEGAYEFAKTFVEERLGKERDGIREWAKKRGTTHLF
jgi:hypothetical protein